MLFKFASLQLPSISATVYVIPYGFLLLFCKVDSTAHLSRGLKPFGVTSLFFSQSMFYKSVRASWAFWHQASVSQLCKSLVLNLWPSSCSSLGHVCHSFAVCCQFIIIVTYIKYTLIYFVYNATERGFIAVSALSGTPLPRNQCMTMSVPMYLLSNTWGGYILNTQVRKWVPDNGTSWKCVIPIYMYFYSWFYYNKYSNHLICLNWKL